MLEPTDETASLKPFSRSKCPPLLAQAKVSCSICSSNSGKYKCPKCLIRTCSVTCFKTHKESEKCIFLSDQWRKIDGFSQFNDEISIKDQQFISKINEKIKMNTKSDSIPKEPMKSPTKIQLPNDQRFLMQNAQLRRIWLYLDGTKNSSGSRYERFSDTIFWTCAVKFVSRCPNGGGQTKNSSDSLLGHANLDSSLALPPDLLHVNKPIVDYSDDEEMGNGAENDCGLSQAESSSEMGMNNPDNGICADDGNSDHSSDNSEGGDEQTNALEWMSFTVENIPENIRVVTLLRQFLRPKPHGPVVTLSQIDMAKMDPFIRASNSLLSSTPALASPDKQNSDNLLVYLEVSLSDEIANKLDDQQTEALRYYVVDPNRTILDNLRNRHINGHPCFVVVLRRDEEFGDLEFPIMCEDEQKQLQKRSNENGQTINERPKWQWKNQGGLRRSNFNWRDRRGARGNGHGHTQPQQWHSGDGGTTWNQSQRQESMTAAHYRPLGFAAFHPYQRPIPNQNRQWRGSSTRGNWNSVGGFYNNTTYNRGRGCF